MKQVVQFAAAMTFLLAASVGLAQQEVRLKSGGVLLGRVTIDGSEAAVRVGDSTMRIPLADVAEITAVAKQEESLPRRLLTTALESRILSGADKESVGILAEAARLAPDDPQIAFWYATSLLDAGHGAAAAKVLEGQRAAIDKAYPGFADRLSSQISRRRQLEVLPPALVDRIDAINSGPRTVRRSNNTERRLYSAVFKLVDQQMAPLAQNAFKIQCNGYDEQLEAFPGGYALFTFTRDSYRSDEPCVVEVKQLGFKPEKFELEASPGQVGAVQEFTAHRFGEDDKRVVQVRLVDRDGKGIQGASVELEPVTGRSGGLVELPQAKTAQGGGASLEALPGDYYVRGQARGFSSASERVSVTAGEGEIVVPPIEMYRSVTESLRVEWRWKPAPPATEETTGDAMLSLNAPRLSGPSNMLMLFQAIQVIQVRDRLAFHVFPYQAGGFSPQGFGDVISLRQLKATKGEDESSANAMKKRFDSLDLTKLSDVEGDLKPAEFEPSRGPGLVVVKPGVIYVGKLPSRDVRINQPGELTFKLMLVSDEDEQEEADDDEERSEDSQDDRRKTNGKSSRRKAARQPASKP